VDDLEAQISARTQGDTVVDVVDTVRKRSDRSNASPAIVMDCRTDCPVVAGNIRHMATAREDSSASLERSRHAACPEAEELASCVEDRCCYHRAH